MISHSSPHGAGRLRHDGGDPIPRQSRDAPCRRNEVSDNGEKGSARASQWWRLWPAACRPMQGTADRAPTMATRRKGVVVQEVINRDGLVVSLVLVRLPSKEPSSDTAQGRKLDEDTSSRSSSLPALRCIGCLHHFAKPSSNAVRRGCHRTRSDGSHVALGGGRERKSFGSSAA